MDSQDKPGGGSARLAAVPRKPPTLRFSIVIEWENARLSDLGRTHRMLDGLAAQISALDPRRFSLRQVVILHDRATVARSLIEGALARGLGPAIGPERLRVIATEGLGYYQLKNFGARHCDGDVVALLDSDVVPEPDWLANLLEPFRRFPRASVVAGTSYIELEGIYSKAVAMWWFFPLRPRGTGLRRVRRFWANNVAFRRRLFLATGFPDSDKFRGQCLSLAGALRRSGVPILERIDARVAHPAPNGWKHFVCRGLCQGHDNVRIGDLPNRPHLATWRASWARFIANLRRARARIRDQRASVGVGAIGAAMAYLLAIGYFGLMFAGERVALRRPALIRKYFPI
jgi:hypothetical protein